MLPCRSWELCFGGILALLSNDDVISNMNIRFISNLALTGIWRRITLEILSWLGLFMIAFCYIFLTDKVIEEYPYPGFYAFVPCFGAGLVIWSNTPGYADRHWKERVTLSSGRFLSYAPFVWIMATFSTKIIECYFKSKQKVSAKMFWLF
eukprot:Pgem_evm1s13468